MKRIFAAIVCLFAIIGFVLVVAYAAVRLGLTKTKGVIDMQHDYFKNQVATNAQRDDWQRTQEWQILKEAIKKDSTTINKVSNMTGIQSRLIIAPLIVEQMRLFSSNREIFKQIFAPLKILGNQNQFSWGIFGIKQETARKIESNLKDPNSEWYLGKQYENILDFTTSDPDSERFERLTDEKDRYYSYLYAALYIKEVLSQWEKAGIKINDRPDIIATLFNLGFSGSEPHEGPRAGGAEIEVGKTTYSFGSLAGSFYASSELTAEFPK